MNIIKVDEVKASVISLLEKVAKKEGHESWKENRITMDVHEEKSDNGTMWFVFTAKPKTKIKNAPSSKIGLYIYESTAHVETFIINCRTGAMLFENSTMKSPEIGVFYLENILYKETQFVDGLVSKLESVSKKKFKKKPYQGKKPAANGYKRPNDGKGGYKPQGQKSYNPYSGQKSYSPRPNGGYSSGYKSSGSYSSQGHGNYSGKRPSRPSKQWSNK